jgi:hypothetical protein
MKSIIITLLLLWLPFSGPAQNVKITIGRGTNCFGRGACSISTESSKNCNAAFIQLANGSVILRIYRKKLSKEEDERVLGEPITSANLNVLKFTMEEPLYFFENIKQFTAPVRSKQLDSLKTGSYSTLITPNHIDITLIKDPLH